MAEGRSRRRTYFVRPDPCCKLTLDGSSAAVLRGGMCEWLKQAVLKTAVPERVPGVRIPLPPPASVSSSFANALRISAAGSRSAQNAPLTPAIRLNLKTAVPERVPGVRIPLPPPAFSFGFLRRSAQNFKYVHIPAPWNSEAAQRRRAQSPSYRRHSQSVLG